MNLTYDNFSNNNATVHTLSCWAPQWLLFGTPWDWWEIKGLVLWLIGDWNRVWSTPEEGGNGADVGWCVTLQLYIPKDHEKRERCPWGNNKKEMRKTWGCLYYYMRCWLIIHKENARYSKYESKMKWTSTHVQVMAHMKQTFVKHEVEIVTQNLLWFPKDKLYIWYFMLVTQTQTVGSFY